MSEDACNPSTTRSFYKINRYTNSDIYKSFALLKTLIFATVQKKFAFPANFKFMAKM